MEFRMVLAQAAVEYGLEISADQLLQFETYYRLLLEWNEKMNLTAITGIQDVAVKHIIDSLSCHHAEMFPPGCAVVDVGTGAGFPGVPLKIYRPDLAVTLVDSLQKRLDFLRFLTDSIGIADIRLIHARAEEIGREPDHREAYDIAVARAVARLNVLAEFCLPLVRVGGWFAAMKGVQYKEEAAEARSAVKKLGGKIETMRAVQLPGLTDGRGIVCIRKISATPSRYPRRPGVPEKKPL